jgi:DNA modification methylase
MSVQILTGDCRETLRTLPRESVHCVVTSPPYFGLRDYGVAGQIGLEASPDAFVDELVAVFRDVRRVLRTDGTLWLNLGDSYAAVNRGENARPRVETLTGIQVANPHADIRTRSEVIKSQKTAGIKQKDLLGVPWLVAFALRADDWWLRQDIIWSKPNPMPESVTDRCTKAHEYIFLLSKSERYYYNQDAIAEPVADATISRLAQDIESQEGSYRVPGKTNGTMKAVRKRADRFGGNKHNGDTTKHSDGSIYEGRETRNRRSVWTVNTEGYSEAHFATFPPALIEPCILAGCPKGGTVLDPFGGAGTTGLVADRLGRNAILIELNPEYAAMAERRIKNDAPLFAVVNS